MQVFLGCQLASDHSKGLPGAFPLSYYHYPLFMCNEYLLVLYDFNVQLKL